MSEYERLYLAAEGKYKTYLLDQTQERWDAYMHADTGMWEYIYESVTPFTKGDTDAAAMYAHTASLGIPEPRAFQAYMALTVGVWGALFGAPTT
jgi:hypothetical protein